MKKLKELFTLDDITLLLSKKQIKDLKSIIYVVEGIDEGSGNGREVSKNEI